MRMSMVTLRTRLTLKDCIVLQSLQANRVSIIVILQGHHHQYCQRQHVPKDRIAMIVRGVHLQDVMDFILCCRLVALLP